MLLYKDLIKIQKLKKIMKNEFVVDECSRLDVFISKKLNFSRNQVEKLIKENGIFVNDILQKKTSFKLKLNDKINIKLPEIKNNSAKFAVDFDIEIIYEDDDILVLNKPANLVVHGADTVKEATLVDWLIEKKYTLSNLNGDIRAGLLHRLDKGTSGAIVIAKNNKTHYFLAKQLLDKSMGRFYLALIDLPLKDDKMIVEKALVRSSSNRLKKIALKEGLNVNGMKDAKSAFVNLLSQDGVNLIAAKLFTGRTHQIRAHLESLNRHILGDVLYGYKEKNYPRVMLHSYFVYFMHPIKNEQIFVKAPLHNDFIQILEKIKKKDIDEKTSLAFIESCFNTFS